MTASAAALPLSEVVARRARIEAERPSHVQNALGTSTHRLDGKTGTDIVSELLRAVNAKIVQIGFDWPLAVDADSGSLGGDSWVTKSIKVGNDYHFVRAYHTAASGEYALKYAIYHDVRFSDAAT